MTTRASALYLGRCHKKANQGPLRIPRPSRPCLLQHIFRTITGATLLRRRNTPNQKVVLPPCAEARRLHRPGRVCFAWRLSPALSWQRFLGARTANLALCTQWHFHFKCPSHTPLTQPGNRRPPPAPPSVRPALHRGEQSGPWGARGGGGGPPLATIGIANWGCCSQWSC